MVEAHRPAIDDSIDDLVDQAGALMRIVDLVPNGQIHLDLLSG
jgi:hypothetical protein